MLTSIRCGRQYVLAFYVMALMLFAAGNSRADGLLYQLPEDGSSVTFDLSWEADADNKITGSLTMSSVGKKEVDGEPCRWIEINLVMVRGGEERTVIAKALIPEKECKRGGKPWENFKTATVKMNEGGAREITEKYGRDAGPLPAFLAGPLTDEQKLPAVAVDSKLGELQCPGVTGSTSFPDRDSTVNVSFENRLHEKAPFGVVTSKLNFQITRNGEQRERGTMNFTLKSVDKGATSKLPDVE